MGGYPLYGYFRIVYCNAEEKNRSEHHLLPALYPCVACIENTWRVGKNIGMEGSFVAVGFMLNTLTREKVIWKLSWLFFVKEKKMAEIAQFHQKLFLRSSS